MDRRKALRHIGYSAGFMVATPTVLSILQSCTTEQASWIPANLSEDEGKMLKRVVDIIIPKTDSPSASEVNVPEFMDKYIGDAINENDQIIVRWKIKGLTDQLKAAYNEDPSKITDEEYTEFLTKNLKEASKGAYELFGKFDSYTDAIMKGEDIESEPLVVSFTALHDIRDMVIFAYKNSEMVGEQVLAYDPVPGAYIGCDDLQKLTGGKAWSL
ncbi:gluconate 2-dehydrogenase subunit 3 family protein [Robertkochia solimangrovi]|uniref:gluconate 2-dehydrogenase subunit 3 family protein n=1 Tax=Robertkochia solimangrovi TaxID=2213046 RepID=UPI00117DC034|nr:gluconate 2-dehydrogenase subunit 3 family protein [Robertkochia solimangrovi]TRZ46284.1 gluconate 2-dehydrogenase subunit 3 family protein [Robertkochia solimangrovi]